MDTFTVTHNRTVFGDITTRICILKTLLTIDLFTMNGSQMDFRISLLLSFLSSDLGESRQCTKTSFPVLLPREDRRRLPKGQAFLLALFKERLKRVLILHLGNFLAERLDLLWSQERKTEDRNHGTSLLACYVFKLRIRSKKTTTNIKELHQSHPLNVDSRKWK